MLLMGQGQPPATSRPVDPFGAPSSKPAFDPFSVSSTKQPAQQPSYDPFSLPQPPGRNAAPPAFDPFSPQGTKSGECILLLILICEKGVCLFEK